MTSKGQKGQSAKSVGEKKKRKSDWPIGWEKVRCGSTVGRQRGLAGWLAHALAESSPETKAGNPTENA